MTLRALGNRRFVIIIVVGRRMAGAAICQAGMAKFSIIPILGVVAL
jgi:hypothetical protein